MLEASFFGVLIFGRRRVPPWFYLFSTAMVALGTTLSAFWIMVNNSWMQVPTGYVLENGAFVPERLEQDHLQFGGVGAISAHAARLLPDRRFLRCRDRRVVHAARRSITPRRASCCGWGLVLAAVLMPVQLLFGHLVGDYVDTLSAGQDGRDRGALER